MRIQDVIATKRDGLPNTREQLEHLVFGYVSGSIPDYQVSAWLMAAYLRGLRPEETVALTQIMADSGRKLDVACLPQPRVDKHSTGGVGDKTSLVVVPLLAACQCTVVKMSGRGLGITGGTVDKLESIPGFRTELSPEEMIRVAAECGCCLAGQSREVAPADRLLYGLRDATATVGSIPLIAASILSKKLATGADLVLLDVKCGSGAFMRTLDDARALAAALVEVGTECGTKVTGCITDMNAPLGRAVGNALEVVEAVETLQGGGPCRFRALCLDLAAEAIIATGAAEDRESARVLAERRLDGGAALERFRRMIQLQGGDPRVCDAPASLLPTVQGVPVLADAMGHVTAIHAGEIGRAAVDLGAGRRAKEDAVDHAVGVVLGVEVGDHVERGEVLGTVYARDDATLRIASDRLQSAIRIEPQPVPPSPIVLERFSPVA